MEQRGTEVIQFSYTSVSKAKAVPPYTLRDQHDKLFVMLQNACISDPCIWDIRFRFWHGLNINNINTTIIVTRNLGLILPLYSQYNEVIATITTITIARIIDSISSYRYWVTGCDHLLRHRAHGIMVNTTIPWKRQNVVIMWLLLCSFIL